MIYMERIAPTAEAIDAWRAQEDANRPKGARYATEYDQYGVNVWTKASRSRCIVGRIVSVVDDSIWYATIRGEGSSNGGRETFIPASKIVRAEGWIVGNRDPRFKREREWREREWLDQAEWAVESWSNALEADYYARS